MFAPFLLRFPLCANEQPQNAFGISRLALLAKVRITTAFVPAQAVLILTLALLIRAKKHPLPTYVSKGRYNLRGTTFVRQQPHGCCLSDFQ